MAADRRALFAQLYLKKLNATDAAIGAGYSKKTAKSQGSRLLRDEKVKALVEAGSKKVADEVGVDVGEVLRELKRIAMADPDAAEMPAAEDEMDPGPLGGALARRRGATLRYEHKLKALELLGKYLKLFAEKGPFDGVPEGVTITINRTVTK